MTTQIILCGDALELVPSVQAPPLAETQDILAAALRAKEQGT